MSELFSCDECGKTVNAEPFLVEAGWRRVEYISDVHHAATDTSDKHFCSASCLKAFTENIRE